MNKVKDFQWPTFLMEAKKRKSLISHTLSITHTLMKQVIKKFNKLMLKANSRKRKNQKLIAKKAKIVMKHHK